MRPFPPRLPLWRNWPRGQTSIWLQAWEVNHRAIAFYVKEGFKDVGQTTFQVGSLQYRDRVLTLTLS